MSPAPQIQPPTKWRYTWETQSQTPTLRLFLFNPKIKPSNHCKNLKVSTKFEQSLLLVTWNGQEEPQSHQTNSSNDFQFTVSIPRVLVDVGSPVDFKAMEDHIEVKMMLVLPIEHPLNVNIGSVLDEELDQDNVVSDRLQSLSVDSDLKSLSSQNGVHLFCKSCSVQLTRRPLRSFVEMPSADWREVADNWFGACCCSFGGISEKLVRKYVSSYIFPQGMCLLDAASIIINKDDLAEQLVPDCFNQSNENDLECGVVGGKNLIESKVGSGSNGRQTLIAENQCEHASESMGNLETEVTEIQKHVDTSFLFSPKMSELSTDVGAVYELSPRFQSHCCIDKMNNISNHSHEGCSHDIPVISSIDTESMRSMEPLKDYRPLLNVSLGSGFMVRTSNLSKNVDWIELHCSHCSSILGAYPSAHDRHAPLDGGIRFVKCYTSTSLPVGGLGNIFRRYTLQRLFAKQLMESASDELSFRTVVRDLRTRSLMLQIVLLNSDVWSCTGYCLEAKDGLRPASKIDLHPVVKVLFADSTNATEPQLRILEEWATINQADEIYMSRDQIKELIDSLEAATGGFPISFSFMQGLSLSSIER